MQIKPLNKKPTPLEIKEWNDEIKAFMRPLNGVEMLVANDLYLMFYNKELSAVERFDAAFDAALMYLVDEAGAPLFAEEDREAVKNASISPMFRMFQKHIEIVAGVQGVEPKDVEIEETKKN